MALTALAGQQHSLLLPQPREAGFDQVELGLYIFRVVQSPLPPPSGWRGGSFYDHPQCPERGRPLHKKGGTTRRWRVAGVVRPTVVVWHIVKEGIAFGLYF